MFFPIFVLSKITHALKHFSFILLLKLETLQGYEGEMFTNKHGSRIKNKSE